MKILSSQLQINPKKPRPVHWGQANLLLTRERIETKNDDVNYGNTNLK